MSTERDHGAGAYGAHGADAGPPGRPNVYHPQTGPAPSYEEYADPASAHGWHNNAYDETAQLPAVPSLPAPREPAEGRADRRRRQRRTGGRRRTVILAGALGAAGTVAVIAALAGGSDSPGPNRPGPSGRGRVAAGDSAAASPRTDTGKPHGLRVRPPRRLEARPGRREAPPLTGGRRLRGRRGPGVPVRRLQGPRCPVGRLRGAALSRASPSGGRAVRCRRHGAGGSRGAAGIVRPKSTVLRPSCFARPAYRETPMT